MQRALCYLKPDVTLTGGLFGALGALGESGYEICAYQVIHMNDQLYRLAYENGFDAARDSWHVNRRFARVGPWIALLLSHEAGGDIQERLKAEQGPAIPSKTSCLRAKIGHLNRIQNAIHVPDTSQEATEQASVLFPGEGFAEIDGNPQPKDVVAEFRRHGYQCRRRSLKAFQAVLKQRVAHRSTRISRVASPGGRGLRSHAGVAIRSAIEQLVLSPSERDLLRTLLIDDFFDGPNRLLKAKNVAEALSRNFIHLTEWDQATLFGFFAYPTIESR
ncbi:MAG: hypothetical protein KF823_09745 [Xanthomonadales bacterium]|nr:hypothetical protein [Xanthomonadales bacterium]